jgi:hypothetical protein
MNQRHGALATPLALLALVGCAGGGSATPTPSPPTSLATGYKPNHASDTYCVEPPNESHSFTDSTAWARTVRFVDDCKGHLTPHLALRCHAFNASHPFVLNLIVKDYRQNDTGLEHIGLGNQQMGDGGFIRQVTDTSTGKVVAAAGTAVKCTAIHKAPLRTACATEASPTLASRGATIVEEPATWKAANFDASNWPGASIYGAAEVGVEDGYNTIVWDGSAKLIWTSDFKVDNTLLCRPSVTSS